MKLGLFEFDNAAWLSSDDYWCLRYKLLIVLVKSYWRDINAILIDSYKDIPLLIKTGTKDC